MDNWRRKRRRPIEREKMSSDQVANLPYMCICAVSFPLFSPYAHLNGPLLKSTQTRTGLRWAEGPIPPPGPQLRVSQEAAVFSLCDSEHEPPPRKPEPQNLHFGLTRLLTKPPKQSIFTDNWTISLKKKRLQ